MRDKSRIHLVGPLAAMAAVAASVAVLAGCPRIGPECGAGKSGCGKQCVDLTADVSHCGACGNACGENEACGGGQCQCRAGAISCGGACVDPQADPAHCGGCGKPCPAGFLCSGGGCVIACPSAGLTECGGACVDVQTSAQHCGGCGRACPGNLTCRSGNCTYDVVAACFSTDQVVGLLAEGDVKGPLVDAPTTPESLASMGRSLLVGGAFSRQLYQLDLAGFQPKQKANGGAVTTGIGPDARQVLVEGTTAYVINAGDNTLQILRRRGEEDPERGNVFEVVSQLSFGANANPQAVAKVGTDLFVPLYGTFSGAPGENAGQQVARVSVADPARPIITRYLDLRRLDLKPFAGSSTPRPSWIVLHRGALYVPLNNLNGFSAGGPGMVAKIDPATEAVTAIDLGADVCLNAIFAASSAQGLLVGCAGDSDYSQFPIVRTVKTGVVLVVGDRPVASWAAACPPEAEGGPCGDPSISRVLAVGDKVYAGDQAAGRLFVLGIEGGRLVERRGYADGGTPIGLCPPGPFGYSNVADLYAP